MVKYVNWPSPKPTVVECYSNENILNHMAEVTPYYDRYEVPDNVKCHIEPAPAYHTYRFDIVYTYNWMTCVITGISSLSKEWMNQNQIDAIVERAVYESKPQNEDCFRYFLKKDILKAIHLALSKMNKHKDIPLAAEDLPGMNAIVTPPCSCPGREGYRLMDTVIHLNDSHQWTREKIADWIDELHDAGTINAEFKPWGESEGSDTQTIPDGWQDLGYTKLEEKE